MTTKGTELAATIWEENDVYWSAGASTNWLWVWISDLLEFFVTSGTSYTNDIPNYDLSSHDSPIVGKVNTNIISYLKQTQNRLITSRPYKNKEGPMLRQSSSKNDKSAS